MQEGNYSDIESFWSSPKYCHCNFSVLLDFDIKLGESLLKYFLVKIQEKIIQLLQK